MRNFNAGAAAPIVIEDDVFVGTDSLLLKGGDRWRGKCGRGWKRRES